MPNGNDIIIIGGSAEVHFDDEIYVKDPVRDAKNRSKHHNKDLKIRRVVITGDIAFDSGDKPEGLRCEIVAHCS